MSELVLREDADGLCTLTLNRPAKRNVLDSATFVALDVPLPPVPGEAIAA